MHRGDLTDAQWERLQPLLPPQRHGKGTTGGRPSNDHRPIINGILWVLRTGAPWDDLPGTLRHSAPRCRAATTAGVRTASGTASTDRQSAGRCRRRPELGTPSCRCHRGSCPPARRGGKKGDPVTEALGRSQGGFSTKVHLRAEGNGKPMAIVLTPGERHETTAFERLMDLGAVKTLFAGSAQAAAPAYRR